MRIITNVFRCLICFVAGLILLLFISDPYVPEGMKNIGSTDVIFMAIFNTIGVFSLATDITVAREFSTPFECISQDNFTLIIYILFTVAPFLMIANILTYFRVGLDSLIFLFSKILGTSYVFSELNEKSLAMAESIRKEKKWSFIIFVGCNIFGTDNAAEKDLIERSYKINAVCLKKELNNLTFSKWLFGKWFGGNHIFIISEDESKNVSQTIEAIEIYKNKKFKNALYVYVSSENKIALIDSVDKGDRLLSDKFKMEIKNRPRELFETKPWKRGLEIEGDFTVRCINTAEETVIGVLKENYETIIKNAKSHNKQISIGIVGLGGYGFELLKAAVWLLQISGFRLTIHIFDKNPDIKKILMQRCPELLSKNYIAGDANHDINIYGGVDCYYSDFDEVIKTINPKENIQMQLVFVALGDDNKNIDIAMRVRQLLSEQAGNKEEKKKIPRIYAVVRDRETTCTRDIENYKRQSYDLSFCGSYQDEYCFADIQQLRRIEKIAFQHHIEWITKDIELWGPIRGKKHKKKLRCLKESKAQLQDRTMSKVVLEAAEGYAQFSYYRKSSMAMESHREQIGKYFSSITPDDAKVMEHMRWNAYMRALGYQRSIERYDLAKVHPCLVPFDELPEDEKTKDVLNYLEKFKEIK